MKKFFLNVWVVVLTISCAASGAFAAEDIAARLNAVLSEGAQSRFWQVSADEVQEMIAQKKKDFVIVDVRPNPAEFTQAHIPGAIAIPTQDMLKPESLKKLPKNTKIILVCVTGQIQNLPVVALRALGHDAYTMAFGYAAWIKGYHGAQKMQDAIGNAADSNYPVQK